MTRLADLQQPKGADLLGEAWSERIAAELAKVLAALNDTGITDPLYFDLVSALAELHAMLCGDLATDATGYSPVEVDEDRGVPYDFDYMRKIGGKK